MVNTQEIMHKIRKYPKLKAVMAIPYRMFMACKLYGFKKSLGQENLRALENANPAAKKIWYFGAVSNYNMGDRSQWCCICEWLEENYPGTEAIPIYSFGFDFYEKKILSILKNVIKKDELIIFQSGYHFTGKSPNENAFYKVVKNFPDNKLVFFPQTFSFDNEKLKNQTAKRFGAHEHVLMLARDKVSFELAKELLPKAEVKLFPDIVTIKIGEKHYTNARDGVLMIIRDDAEQFYDKKEIAQCAHEIEKTARVDISDTTIKGAACTREEYTEYISNLIDSYARYKCIVTDRFHGTIFGLAAGTPVIVLKTTDHKVTVGAEWFKPIYPNMIKTADTLKQAAKLAKDILESDSKHKPEAYFKANYYDKLKQMILDLR